MATTEGVYRRSGLNSFHFGTEWQPLDANSFRVGYKTDTLSGLSALAGLTTGLGIHLWGLEFAYAWSPYGDLGNAHYFSLVVHLGSRADARRNLVYAPRTKKQRTVMASDDADDPEFQQLMELFLRDESPVVRRATR